MVSLLIFLLLVALAYFLGVPTESRADPNDATYTPRPEWYFLFLFQLLKYFPGKLEVIGVMVIPGLFILLLFALPFIDRSPRRHFLNRPLASIAALAVVGGITTLTILSVREAPRLRSRPRLIKLRRYTQPTVPIATARPLSFRKERICTN